MPTAAGGTAASEWVIGAPLNKAMSKNVPIGAGATVTSAIVEIGPSNAELTVDYEMTGGASSDLTVSVYPCKSDGTPMGVSLTPIRSVGPTQAAGVVSYSATYDVSGLYKVQIQGKNSNASAQTINEVSWRVTNQS